MIARPEAAALCRSPSRDRAAAHAVPAYSGDDATKGARLQRLLFGAEQAEGAGRLQEAQVNLGSINLRLPAACMQAVSSGSTQDEQEAPGHQRLAAGPHGLSAACCCCALAGCFLRHPARCRLKASCAMPDPLQSRFQRRCAFIGQALWLELRCFLAAESLRDDATRAHAAPLLQTCGRRLAGLLSRPELMRCAAIGAQLIAACAST